MLTPGIKHRPPINLSMIPGYPELLATQYKRIASQHSVDDVSQIFTASTLCDLMAMTATGCAVYLDLFCSNLDRFIFNVTVPITSKVKINPDGSESMVEDDLTTLSAVACVASSDDLPFGYEIFIPHHTEGWQAHVRRATKGALNHTTVIHGDDPLFWLAPIVVILERVMKANNGRSIEDLLGLRKSVAIKSGDCFSATLMMD